MNFELKDIPERTSKPRNSGINMIMDKGLSIRQTEDFVAANSDLVDFVKFGFGTSYITKNLEQKIKIYKDAGIKTYFGGTLFEAFVIRGQFNDYVKLIEKYKMEAAEVSDGSVTMNHKLKCDYIKKLSKNHIVFSEVGSKEEGIIIHPAKWVSMMNDELEAGSFKVIAEARESGNVGIYRSSGHAHTILINKILSKVPKENILWEAPQKSQQAWFIKLLGANVNLGNIGPDDVIPLECLRLGLRGDTFFTFMPEGTSKEVKK